MQRYQITFNQEGQHQTDIVLGATRAKAVKAFSIKHPDVDPDNIVSIDPAAPGAKATVSSAPQHARQAPSASAAAIASARPEYNSDYGAARGISSFISGVGWVVVVIGVLIALAGAGQGYALAILPGLGLAVAGIIVVASGQVTRAAVDNADHTREILTLLKKQTAPKV